MKAGGKGRGEPASDGDGDRRGEQGLAARGGNGGRRRGAGLAPLRRPVSRGGERRKSWPRRKTEGGSSGT